LSVICDRFAHVKFLLSSWHYAYQHVVSEYFGHCKHEKSVIQGVSASAPAMEQSLFCSIELPL